MEFVYNDGGRKAAGFKGKAGDCVTRAIAIATGLPYLEVYDKLNGIAKVHERTKIRKSKAKERSSSRTGVYKDTYSRYLKELGWVKHSTSGFGEKPIRFNGDELPAGRLIVKKRKHLVAVIDGVLNDTWDCSIAHEFETGKLVPDGAAIYGYWSAA
jgi:hypothetical protein